MQYKYIAIEGNIGVGKTSLTKLLGKETGRSILLENFKNNPFLKTFYQEKTMAFQLEMSFLLERYLQFKSVDKEAMLFSDHFYLKTQIFAKSNLSNSEYLLFDKYYNALKKDTRQPDLILYLYSENNRLIKNIKKRGRKIEKNISEEYLNEIGIQYNRVLSEQSDLRLVTCDVTAIDFVKNRDDFDKILAILKEKHPIGTTKIIFS